MHLWLGSVGRGRLRAFSFSQAWLQSGRFAGPGCGHRRWRARWRRGGGHIVPVAVIGFVGVVAGVFGARVGERDAHGLQARVAQAAQRVFDAVLLGFRCLHRENNVLNLVAQNNGVGNAQQRRAVDDHLLEAQRLRLVEQYAQLGAHQQLHRVGRRGPGGQHAQVGHLGGENQALGAHIAGQQVRKTALVGQAQRLVHRGLAHIGVDQQHMLAQLGEVDRQRDGRGRFAFSLAAASDHEALGRAIGGGKLQRCSHRAVGLGEGAARVAVGQQGHGVAAAALGRFGMGDPAQQRQAEEAFDLVGVFDGIVHLLAQQRGQHAQEAAEQDAQRQVDQRFRLGREQRGLGFVNDAHVVGRQTARYAHFFQPLQQAVVNLAVGIELALQQVHVNAAVLHR